MLTVTTFPDCVSGQMAKIKVIHPKSIAVSNLIIRQTSDLVPLSLNHLSSTWHNGEQTDGRKCPSVHEPECFGPPTGPPWLPASQCLLMCLSILLYRSCCLHSCTSSQCQTCRKVGVGSLQHRLSWQSDCPSKKKQHFHTVCVV